MYFEEFVFSDLAGDQRGLQTRHAWIGFRKNLNTSKNKFPSKSSLIRIMKYVDESSRHGQIEEG